ncbi:MAG: hypothetical protein Q9163_005749 [Psora crenata]
MRYDLPHRVHTAKAYPLPSPNGSTVVAYGHDHGLRVVWLGGRSFKRAHQRQHRPAVNGAGIDLPVILNDDDDLPLPDHPDEPEFESEDEHDPSSPYNPVIQTLDLLAGTGVLKIAFPQLALGITTSSVSCPALLSQKLVMALAGSDCSVRVLTLPLMPPSPRMKARLQARSTPSTMLHGNSSFGEEIIMLSNGPASQSLPGGVSLTFTSSLSDRTADVEMADADGGSNDARQGTSRAVRDSDGLSRPPAHPVWELLIASHSADLSGLLLIYTVPLSRDGTTIRAGPSTSMITQQLDSPAKAIRFNSALYPAPGHTQLLIIEKRVVRIFQVKEIAKATLGSFLLDLHPNTQHIMDAHWLLQGKAILALFQGGEWAVWDISNVRPTTASAVRNGSPRPRKVSNARLSPALVASSQHVPWMAFAMEGRVGASLKVKKSVKAHLTREHTPSFAPMTPGTRKVRQDALFTKSAPPSECPLQVYGGLSVAYTFETCSGQAVDEYVLLWHGNDITVIPSFRKYWESKTRGSGSLLTTDVRVELRTVQNVDLSGEHCQEVGLMNLRRQNTDRQCSILITGERRIAIIVSPSRECADSEDIARVDSLPSSGDQQLLARGELDVSGMNRILAGMSQGQAHAVGTSKALT